MRIIKTIRDIDFGFNIETPAVYRERKAARSVVFDENKKIALLHVTKKGYHKLPGGGIEKGEDVRVALERELLEEIGCYAGNVQELGIIKEYRNKSELHQISYCFASNLIGEKGTPNFEESEIADGFVPVWLSLEEAIKTLERERDRCNDYEGKFIRLRDLTFLKEAEKISSIRLNSIPRPSI